MVTGPFIQSYSAPVIAPPEDPDADVEATGPWSDENLLKSIMLSLADGLGTSEVVSTRPFEGENLLKSILSPTLLIFGVVIDNTSFFAAAFSENFEEFVASFSLAVGLTLVSDLIFDVNEFLYFFSFVMLLISFSVTICSTVPLMLSMLSFSRT